MSNDEHFSENEIASTYAIQMHANSSTSANAANVLLSTVLLNIKDKFRNSHVAGAVLDSDSQVNLITKNLAVKLALPKRNISMSIQALEKRCEIFHAMRNLSGWETTYFSIH